MLLPKSSCAYIPYIKSVAPRVCLAKVSFWVSFGLDMKTEVGVVILMCLKKNKQKKNIPIIILILNTYTHLYIYIYGFIGLIPKVQVLC